MSEHGEQRSLRLRLDYLKPELALEALGVQHTVVVFGSTRLEAPERLDGEPYSELAVQRSRYYTIAREFGRIIGRSGEGPNDNRLIVVTGGGSGAMEAANRGAHDVGAVSCGFNIALPLEQTPNPYITPELSFSFRYFALRKLHFMLRARALIAFPGGYGTLDEVFEVLCLVQTGKREALPIVLVGSEFWSRAIDFDFLLEREMISAEDLELFVIEESAEAAWKAILNWYASRDLPLMKDPAEAARDQNTPD